MTDASDDLLPPSDPTVAAAADAPAPAPADGVGLQKIVSSLPVDHAGTTVYLKGWRLEGSERPPIVIVHDLGEHAEVYRRTAENFALHGYTTYVFDLRGHGRSGRRLGHAPSFTVLVRDLLQVAAWVRHKEGGRAPIILGHGIGALITMEFTKNHGAFCRAAILSAPCLELTSETGPFARLILKFLADFSPTLRLPTMLTPRFARDLGQRLAQEARDMGEEQARLVPFPRLTAIFAHELLNAIKRAEARFIEYHGSVLILCPERDHVASYGQLKKSAALHDEHNLKIADLHDIGHSVFAEDATREVAMKVILPWLATATEPPKSDDQGAEVRVHGASRAPVRLDGEKPGATKG